MKKRTRMIALLMGITLMVCACSNTTEEKEPVASESQQEEKPAPEEAEHQGKLDEIVPTAYNNVEGLALEPGT